jgi:hypothetical protein
MYIQYVVALDKSAARYMGARRVDLHQRRGLHQYPRLALEAVLTPLLAARRSELLLIDLPRRLYRDVTNSRCCPHPPHRPFPT